MKNEENVIYKMNIRKRRAGYFHELILLLQTFKVTQRAQF